MSIRTFKLFIFVQSNESKIITENYSSQKNSSFPTTRSLRFFLISIKMDPESKVMGFQFEPQRSISSHEGFFQDSSDEGNTTERGTFVRKDCDPSVW